jgi:hypothetical protein
MPVAAPVINTVLPEKSKATAVIVIFLLLVIAEFWAFRTVSSG